MSTLKPARKISRREKLREDTVVTFYARVVDLFDNNRNVVYGAFAGILVIVAAILGWGYLQDQKQAEAADAMAPAVRNYELGLYREALDGVAGSPGLLAVADEYGRTSAGNLARFYAADAAFRLGELDQALELFRSYDREADYLGASSLAGEAAILETRGEHAEAGRLYERAAGFVEGNDLAPQYLIDAGRAFEAAGEYDDAIEVYERVAEDFADAQVAQNTDFLIARARARAAGTS